jgi:hypothetical protein
MILTTGHFQIWEKQQTLVWKASDNTMRHSIYPLSLTVGPDKLECLSQPSFLNLFSYFQERLELTKAKH